MVFCSYTGKTTANGRKDNERVGLSEGVSGKGTVSGVKKGMAYGLGEKLRLGCRSSAARVGRSGEQKH
jgi:hypothetical protein